MDLYGTARGLEGKEEDHVVTTEGRGEALPHRSTSGGIRCSRDPHPLVRARLNAGKIFVPQFGWIQRICGGETLGDRRGLSQA